jgi:hypothetical protein
MFIKTTKYKLSPSLLNFFIFIFCREGQIRILRLDLKEKKGIMKIIINKNGKFYAFKKSLGQKH